MEYAKGCALIRKRAQGVCTDTPCVRVNPARGCTGSMHGDVLFQMRNPALVLVKLHAAGDCPAL